MEGRKEAVVCTSVVESPRRSAVVTHATSMCACARHSCSILKNVGRKMCVWCQKFLSLVGFVQAAWQSLLLFDFV